MMVAIALARLIGQCWQVHAFYLVSLLFIAMLASVFFHFVSLLFIAVVDPYTPLFKIMLLNYSCMFTFYAWFSYSYS